MESEEIKVMGREGRRSFLKSFVGLMFDGWWEVKGKFRKINCAFVCKILTWRKRKRRDETEWKAPYTRNTTTQKLSWKYFIIFQINLCEKVKKMRKKLDRAECGNSHWHIHSSSSQRANDFAEKMTIACFEILSSSDLAVAANFFLLFAFSGKTKRQNEQSIWRFKSMKKSRAHTKKERKGADWKAQETAEKKLQACPKILIQLQIIFIQTLSRRRRLSRELWVFYIDKYSQEKRALNRFLNEKFIRRRSALVSRGRHDSVSRATSPSCSVWMTNDEHGKKCCVHLIYVLLWCSSGRQEGLKRL